METRVLQGLDLNNLEIGRRRTYGHSNRGTTGLVVARVLHTFLTILSRIHRQPEHVMTFLLVEMETSGSLDGQQRLVVKGRFAPKAFEGIMQSYVNCLLDCLDLSSEYHTLDVANRIGAAVYVQKQKDQRKHRKRPKAKHSQWRGKVKGLVDGEKKHILAQQAETLLHSLRLRFSDLQQTVLDMSKIQHSKCLPIAQPMSISNFS
ncbi:eukaryotic translation initiation factor 2 subunit beta-like isoform X2 [Actinidia eriantha]|uniref:eukaryotic translation initiation factor 2 subunit beta-like isoform X2 n=1 Tax=Actinidia eriantha TaxID=165200 RepID=UPI002582794E|nr:eukaryotic translation initiation factor 2 subunit beta-like isoform X2 [Actinidia eriantha]